MLLVLDVYNLLLDELRTDKRGLSCEVGEYNRLIRLVNQEIFEQYVKRFEEGHESSNELGFLKVHNYSLTLTSGVATLPANYDRIIGKPRILSGSSYVNVDVVSTYELACRSDDYLTEPTTTYPVCTIGGIDAYEDLQIRVSPTTITTVWIDYLRELSVPFLDYYINDTTLEYTFLDETTDPYTITEGYTYSDGTVGDTTVVSQTENLRWGEGDLSLILTKLVNRLSKQLPDELLLQASTAEQIKSDAE